MKKGGNSGDKGENDQDLWNYVTRGIKAYKPSGAPSPVKPAIRKASTPLREKTKPVLPRHPPAKAPVPQGFDRSTETKLKRGKLALEGRLDLHGMTQAEAFAALHRFIHAAVAQEKRTVLVITGKGQRFEGVLKRMVPLWLEEPELVCHLVAITPAQPKDGGTGAFYLRLKKSKH